MSTITTVNLEIVFKKETPTEIRTWLNSNNFLDVIQSDNYKDLIPTYILENADRCAILYTPPDKDYEYSYDKQLRKLIMIKEHKNKDNDWEKFINYIMPYIDKEQSLGFISNDYYSTVEKIMFTESDDDEVLVLERIIPQICNSWYGDEQYIDIDMDISELEELYNKNKEEK